MSDETPIADIDKYNLLMQKSMIDKIYFMDKVEADVFIDVGCADGALIKFLARNFPEHEYIGYDNDHEMIEKAYKEYDKPENVAFVSTESMLDQMVFEAQKADKKICLILSSMLHEVYSYSRDVSLFLDWIFNQIRPEYIAIRDMSVSKTASRSSDPITVARVRQVFDNNKISEWETKWGSLDENWSLTHFFLTYRYTHNWERELRENYLPITKEELLGLIPKEYFPRFIEHYTLPFLRGEVKKDFGVDLQEPTHLKLILER